MVCRVDWTGVGGLKAGKRPTEVFAVAQAGGVMSTWTQMGTMGPLENWPATVELDLRHVVFGF